MSLDRQREIAAHRVFALLKFRVADIVLAMIVTVASYKGGVGKSTTAIHLADYLAGYGSTVLIDGDPNWSVTGWAKRGSPRFPVVDARQTARVARESDHVVIDTQARPTPDDLEALIDGCDLLVIPTSPDAFALDALMLTVEAMRGLALDRYRILLTMVPPKPSRDGEEARAMIVEAGLPIFRGHVRRFAAYAKAALAGVTVRAVRDPRATEAWVDYFEVCREFYLPLVDESPGETTARMNEERANAGADHDGE